MNNDYQKVKSLYSIYKNKLSSTNTGEMPEDSFSSIRDICDITKPKSILEIGFNRGNSALMWLLNSEASLISIDIRKKEELKSSLEVINSEFGNRFNYYTLDAYKELSFKNEWVGKFDLIFIDCWHVPIGYELETHTSLYFGSPFIAYDDYLNHKHSGYIKNFVKNNPNLEEIKTYNTGTGQSLIKNINYPRTKGNVEILENC